MVSMPLRVKKVMRVGRVAARYLKKQSKEKHLLLKAIVMSKSKFSKSNSYDEIVRELSILNLLNHIHKIRTNLKMSFPDRTTRSSSSSNEGASVKRGKK